MNGQILTKIENLEKELKEVKALLKKRVNKKSISKKTPAKKLILMKSLWNKMQITDEQLEEAKKAVFNFDIEKHIGRV